MQDKWDTKKLVIDHKLINCSRTEAASHECLELSTTCDDQYRVIEQMCKGLETLLATLSFSSDFWALGGTAVPQHMHVVSCGAIR